VLNGFKGGITCLVFLERLKVLILEKMNLIKEDLRKLYNNKPEESKKIEEGRRSSCMKYNFVFIKQL
jgi:hypothetical protein